MSQRSVAQISFAPVTPAVSASPQQPAQQASVQIQSQVQPQVQAQPQVQHQPRSRNRGAYQQQTVQPQAQQTQVRQQQVVVQQPQVSQVQYEEKPPQPPSASNKRVVGRSASGQVHLGRPRGRRSSSENEYGSPSTPFYGFKMSLRAPKAGDAFFTEQKMEKRFDEEEKRGTTSRVADWIARVLQGQVQALNGHEWKQVSEFLKDGTVLCSLMNRLLRHAGMDPIGYRKKVNSAFVAMNNIQVFIDACKRYGVPDSSLFQPSDLYEGKKAHMLTIMNCLNALGCVANARGFTPPYEEPAPPKADWCKDECYD